MDVEQVRAWVSKIDAMSVDDESAHAAEDSMYRAVLEAIAQGSPDAPLLAEEALKSDNIEFARWYA